MFPKRPSLHTKYNFMVTCVHGGILSGAAIGINFNLFTWPTETEDDSQSEAAAEDVDDVHVHDHAGIGLYFTLHLSSY